MSSDKALVGDEALGDGEIFQSICAAAIREGVESEKCVVAQHRTTKQQKATFVSHLETCKVNNVPIEWVIGRCRHNYHTLHPT